MTRFSSFASASFANASRLPLAALVAPIAGMVATGFVALHATTSRR
jgi:hypothetical protein